MFDKLGDLICTLKRIVLGRSCLLELVDVAEDVVEALFANCPLAFFTLTTPSHGLLLNELLNLFTGAYTDSLVDILVGYFGWRGGHLSLYRHCNILIFLGIPN